MANSVARAQARGVTFSNDHSGENRQELLSQVADFRTPVLCVKEPDNAYDENAVKLVSSQVRFEHVRILQICWVSLLVSRLGLSSAE